MATDLRTSLRNQLRNELGLDPEAPIVITIANFQPEKNLSMMVESIAWLRRELPAAKLVMIGDGPMRGTVESKVQELDLGRNVLIMGAQAEAWRYLPLADVFCLSSVEEGLPVSVMEAMHVRLPVVATRVGGLGEIIDDGANGRLVAVGDSVGMARALLDILTDDELRRSMSAACETASDNFSIIEAARRHRSLYLSLISP